MSQKILDEYYKIVEPILNNKEFEKRKMYMHHEEDSVYSHSIKVSKLAYKIAYYLKLDKESIAIGGLLHDFYDSPWQIDGVAIKSKSFFEGHGFVHAKQAVKNAKLHFPELMNKRIEDMILKHMFPLNIMPPKYLESWVITFCDKYVSLEVLKKPKQIPKYIGINKVKK